MHDLSKYSNEEMRIAKYADGTRSPHQICREKEGYSPSWIHHYHKNKHHFQYWWDEDEYGKIIPIKMPFKYVIEMFCDMVAAGQTYMKDKWSVDAPLAYYEKCCRNKRIQHKESEALLVYLFMMLKEHQTLKNFATYFKYAKKALKEAYDSGKTSVFMDAMNKGQLTYIN